MRRSDERFKQLCNSLPFGIFETDPAGRCSYTNSRWSEICERAANENTGLGWTQAIHPDDRQATLSAWTAAAEAGREWANEVRLLGSGGVERWGRLVACPMFLPNGELLGYVGTLEDITARKFSSAEVSHDPTP